MSSTHQPPSLLERIANKIDGDLKITDEQILKNREIVENYQCENKLFKTYYNDHIRPKALGFEEQRIDALIATKQRKIKVPLVTATLIIVGIICLLLTKGSSLSILILLSGGAFPYICTNHITAYQTAVKRNIYPLIFKFFGDDFKYSYLTKHSLMPNFTYIMESSN